MPPDVIEAVFLVFKAESWFEIRGRGWCAVTKLDRDTEDFSHLIGSEVIIDRALYRVRAVERFAHCPPWRKDEPISLLVEGEPPEGAWLQGTAS